MTINIKNLTDNDNLIEINNIKDIFAILVQLNKTLKLTDLHNDKTIEIDQNIEKLIHLIYKSWKIDEIELLKAKQLVIDTYNNITLLEFEKYWFSNETKIFLNLFNKKIKDLI